VVLAGMLLLNVFASNDGLLISLAQRDTFYMRQALQQASAALALGEVPVGCVLVRDEHVLSRGHNLANACKDATRHAELVAVDKLLSLQQACNSSRCLSDSGGRLLEVQ